MPAVLVAFAAYLLIGCAAMEVPDSAAFPGPRFFPLVIAVGILVLTLAEVVRIARSRTRPAEEADDDDADAAAGAVTAGEGEPPAAPGFSWASLAWVVGGFLIFALLLETLGWVIGGGLLFWAVARGFGARRDLVSLVAGLTVSSLAYILFDMVLGLNLPSGILGGGF
ncbi:tripartite tricarboxylate transporter TctB family protein [Rothia sp. BD8]|uniref:tripartite tricarboxylate transporter TctB family protein n=1 Tax=Rothia sp. BD8 TaxID=2953894 RepID=UPI0038416B75